MSRIEYYQFQSFELGKILYTGMPPDWREYGSISREATLPLPWEPYSQLHCQAPASVHSSQRKSSRWLAIMLIVFFRGCSPVMTLGLFCHCQLVTSSDEWLLTRALPVPEETRRAYAHRAQS